MLLEFFWRYHLPKAIELFHGLCNGNFKVWSCKIFLDTSFYQCFDVKAKNNRLCNLFIFIQDIICHAKHVLCCTLNSRETISELLDIKLHGFTIPLWWISFLSSLYDTSMPSGNQQTCPHSSLMPRKLPFNACSHGTDKTYIRTRFNFFKMDSLYNECMVETYWYHLAFWNFKVNVM